MKSVGLWPEGVGGLVGGEGRDYLHWQRISQLWKFSRQKRNKTMSVIYENTNISIRIGELDESHIDHTAYLRPY